MKVTLINPPLISKKNDPHTGLIFMPFMLAHLLSYLKQCGAQTQLIDGLGENPWKFSDFGKMQIQGLTLEEIVTKIDPESEVCFFYFGGIVAYSGIVTLLQNIKQKFPKMICILVENAQAVTAPSLKKDAGHFLDLGFDILLYGDVEKPAGIVLEHLSERKALPEIDGLIFKRSDGSVFIGEGLPIDSDLDQLPFPAWEDFPLKNYWKIGYAHGPMEGPYLPLLTSRGCPVNCRFCSIPGTNKRRWRSRSPKNVCDELQYFSEKLGVTEFHLEDVNPTVNNNRIVEFCEEILRRNLKIRWKIVAGTKIETMKLETIPLMAKAGCTFIGFAPETGSQELLKKMNKPFNHELALKMVKSMHEHRITAQAVFVLGFPEETKSDVVETAKYIRKLAFAGVDEIAQYIIVPMPGSAIFDQIKGYENYSDITFSPTWRADYKSLDFRRKKQYLVFLFWKTLLFPNKIVQNIANVFRRKFKTKMEQALYRVTLWHVEKWLRNNH